MLIAKIRARYVHMNNAQVSVQKYTDGSLALVAEDLDEYGLPNTETFSVNLGPAYGLNPPEGHVYIKDYAEHEGLASALAEVGIVTIVEKVHFGPHSSTAHLVKINDALVKEEG